MEPEAAAIVTEKPKRVLTEAQRLAFLKGREKRMANIEKKRLEKEELNAAAVAPKSPEPAPAPAPAPAPPKPVLERQTAGDHDVIVDRIVERIKPLLVRPPTPPAPKSKRTYVRKPKEPAPIQSPPPSFVSPVKKFIWL